MDHLQQLEESALQLGLEPRQGAPLNPAPSSKGVAPESERPPSRTTSQQQGSGGPRMASRPASRAASIRSAAEPAVGSSSAKPSPSLGPVAASQLDRSPGVPSSSRPATGNPLSRGQSLAVRATPSGLNSKAGSRPGTAQVSRQPSDADLGLPPSVYGGGYGPYAGLLGIGGSAPLPGGFLASPFPAGGFAPAVPTAPAPAPPPTVRDSSQWLVPTALTQPFQSTWGQKTNIKGRVLQATEREAQLRAEVETQALEIEQLEQQRFAAEQRADGLSEHCDKLIAECERLQAELQVERSHPAVDQVKELRQELRDATVVEARLRKQVEILEERLRHETERRMLAESRSKDLEAGCPPPRGWRPRPC